jgi:hypothetical protein
VIKVLKDFESIVVDERTLIVKAANMIQPKEEAVVVKAE